MTTNHVLTRDDLIRTMFGAAAFQILNAGCRLGLFELLQDKGPMTADEVADGLGLRNRPADILLLGSTALRLTEVHEGRYRNAALLRDMFHDGTWEILADIVEFESEIVYLPQADFITSLREDRNAGLGRLPGEGTDLYRRLAGTPELERLFFRCMRSWSRLSNPVLVAEADLHGVCRVLDVGGGDGVNSIALASANPDITFTVMDLPGAAAIAKDRIEQNALGERIDVVEQDIFAAEPYPAGYDCVLFANQFVIWSPDENRALLRKAYDALPGGGRVMVFNAMSAESGDGPLYAALDNVYFATLPTRSSVLYRWDQYEQWFADVGFRDVRRSPGDTWTPHGLISAVK